MFTRHDDDLVCQVPISFAQAALGGQVQVPTLDGRADVDLPAGTQHAQTFTLKGKGLPDLRSYKKGDQIVQILIEIPKKLTDRQRELLTEYAESEDHAVMPQKRSFFGKVKDLFDGD
jgi:molecular chaperone DnaJ